MGENDNMIGILIVTHGDLADAFVKSAQMTVGKKENVMEIGLYGGESPDTLQDEIAEDIKKLGTDEVIDPLDEEPIKRVKDLTEGRGADVVIDTVALSSAAEQAVQMVGPMGRIVFYSSIHPSGPISISPT